MSLSRGVVMKLCVDTMCVGRLNVMIAGAKQYHTCMLFHLSPIECQWFLALVYLKGGGPPCVTILYTCTTALSIVYMTPPSVWLRYRHYTPPHCALSCVLAATVFYKVMYVPTWAFHPDITSGLFSHLVWFFILQETLECHWAVACYVLLNYWFNQPQPLNKIQDT